MRLNSVFLCLGVLLSQHPISFGQSVQSDSSFLQRSVSYAISLHSQSVGKYSHLYNGSAYVDYDISIDGHQYFISDDSEEGTVYYNGALYHDVPMLYDIRNDELIVDEYSFPHKIRLLAEKVSYFSVRNHNFVRIVADSLTNTAIKTGFYDQLYTGQIQLLAKRIKLINEEIASGKVEAEFVEKNQYFIWKDNRYFLVKSKKSVLKILGERKKELQKGLRENKLKFRTNKEEAMILMVKTYDASPN
jgi:hypothetical protein